MPSEAEEELDLNANILQLYPDPASFVDVLKSANRKDIASEVFMQLLDAYQRGKREEDDPTR